MHNKVNVRNYLVWTVLFPLMFLCVSIMLLGAAAAAMLDRLGNVERVLRGVRRS